MPITSQTEIQKIFDKASELGIQHYHWIPLEPPRKPNSGNATQDEAADKIAEQQFNWILEDNATDSDGMFYPYPGDPKEEKVKKLGYVYKTVEEFVKTRTATDDVETDENADPDTPHGKPRKEWKWPKPTADTSHVDPVKVSEDGTEHFSDNELENLEKNLAAKGQKREAKFLNELGRFIGSKTVGMRRLDVIYEWIILRATVLLNDLDKAVQAKSFELYRPAWSNYINFLRDLDDHEPEKKKEPLDPNPKNKSGKSGYGRSIKWSYITPVIHGGRIHAARIIVHWNPHSSSMGVPIRHP